ncbi:MAG: TetR/AcrR family transcriptional regulator [Anaerolineae bacterium]|jgi:AcrR family transcriptional regulator|nr:TetR/AcrR family transcriptional regulator [Anaerolineae bacterium]MBT7189678.1 TetR/AcrR family transcriptional regulator [Anaerolineae bacterium]MBT7988248.1 TetR/AcrR family transcriptional regulator [Anaerolineae bacterium]
MPRPKKTAEEIQAMREKILDVALNILEEEGPKAITSRAIAKRLKVSHMSLFTYFKNQSEIRSALRERVMAEVRIPLNEIEERAQSENIPALLEEVWMLFADFAREKPFLYRLAWVTPEAGGIDTEEKHQQRRAIVNQLARILKLGMERGDFEPRDPALTALTVLGMFNMPFMLFHNGRLPDESLRDRMVDEVFSAVMGYLGKKEKSQ